MTRVVVLGAYGQLGSAVAAELAKDGSLDVVLTGRDDGRLRALGAGLGDRVSTAQLDVTDTDAASRVGGGSELIVNCLGPSLFEHAFDMALSCGANYTDLLSQPTAEHDSRARSAGILAVPNQGLSPGLSNIIAAHFARETTQIDTLEIAYALNRAVAPTRAMLDTLVWGFSSQTAGRGYFQDGEFVLAGPREGSKLVAFPEPFGTSLAYYRPHPETTSLPLSFPSLRYCAVRAAYSEEVQRDMWTLDKYGLLDPEVAEVVKDAIFARHGGRGTSTGDGSFAMVVDVSGTRGGRRLQRHYDVATTYLHTGTCAAVGARIMARHGATALGVVEPELYFDPAEFLAELADVGVDVTWTDTASEEKSSSTVD